MDALDRIFPAVLPGERLVVRYLLLDGSATDVIGWLDAIDPVHVGVRDLSGNLLSIARERIVVARRVPPARGGRHPLRTSAEELEQLHVQAWVADSEPLGDWTLRAGGGFSGRANSCLAVGDPGMPVIEAASRIVSFGAKHHIPPRAQVIAGSDIEQQLRGLGWAEVGTATDVLVARLSEVLKQGRPDPAIRLSESLEPAWWEAYQLSRPNQADPEVVRRILESNPPRAFAGADHEGRLVAIGRGHIAGTWVGITALWTAPNHRRQGLATKVLLRLGHWAARMGAQNANLQVASQNAAAHRAYEGAGFVRHHGCLYLAPEHPQASSGPEPRTSG
jgi:N-acetylglutamate synthase